MASLRHTNVVALLGLCRQPPALITGRGRVATAGSTGELLARRCGPASAHALQAACRASLHHPPLAAEYCARGGLDEVLAQARKDPAVGAQLTWARRLQLVGPGGPALQADSLSSRRAPPFLPGTASPPPPPPGAGRRKGHGLPAQPRGGLPAPRPGAPAGRESTGRWAHRMRVPPVRTHSLALLAGTCAACLALPSAEVAQPACG